MQFPFVIAFPWTFADYLILVRCMASRRRWYTRTVFVAAVIWSSVAFVFPFGLAIYKGYDPWVTVTQIVLDKIGRAHV